MLGHISRVRLEGLGSVANSVADSNVHIIMFAPKMENGLNNAPLYSSRRTLNGSNAADS